MIRSHRRPEPLRRAVFAAAVSLAALALVAGATLWSMDRATADSILTTDQMSQACKDRLAQGTKGVPSGSVNWLRNCASVPPAPAPTSSPSGTPSSTATPPPTVSPTPTSTTTSPSPSPTTTSPSSSPSPTPTSTATGCVALPSACGFPDGTNTGASGTLTNASGNVTLGTSGQVYHDVNLSGCITITAANVVVRNVKVTCSGFYGIDVSSSFPTASATLSYVTVSCLDNGGTGIGEHHLTVDHADVSHCENGFDVDHDATIADSWCHDIGGYDPDCYQGQSTANVIIEHNTFVACYLCNSAIIDGWVGYPLNGFVVDSNLLSGGGFTLYCPSQTNNPTGVAITNNRFGTSYYTNGYATGCTGFPWSGNVRDATGASLPAE